MSLKTANIKGNEIKGFYFELILIPPQPQIHSKDQNPGLYDQKHLLCTSYDQCGERTDSSHDTLIIDCFIDIQILYKDEYHSSYSSCVYVYMYIYIQYHIPGNNIHTQNRSNQVPYNTAFTTIQTQPAVCIH